MQEPFPKRSFGNGLFKIYLQSLRIINVKDGLLTDQGCSSGEEVAHEDVVNYLECATTKPML